VTILTPIMQPKSTSRLSPKQNKYRDHNYKVRFV
jgi:hypothetical protein